MMDLVCSGHTSHLYYENLDLGFKLVPKLNVSNEREIGCSSIKRNNRKGSFGYWLCRGCCHRKSMFDDGQVFRLLNVRNTEEHKTKLQDKSFTKMM